MSREDLSALRTLALEVSLYMPGYHLAAHPEDENDHWNPSA
jgi:hypothetical protein